MVNFIDLLTQPDDITCGPTSAAMLLRYYGKDVEIDKIKKITRTVWFNKGGKDFGMTAPELVRRSLQHYGLNSFVKYGNLHDLERIICKNNPCIVLLRSGEWNWHYVVVVGYDSEFIFFANPTNGEIVGLSRSEFYRSWEWSGDMRGNDCSWYVAFWLRALEIYPCSYVYVDNNI